MTQTWNPTILQRDCEALTVPHGERVALTAGGEVEITQRLGSSVTVRTQMGTLLRIDDTDADALGLDPAPETTVHVTRQTGTFDFADVTAALRGVYDPEIPINIVDLGLVYRCDEVALDDGRRRIEIDMTMTAPGCGMGDVIARDAEAAVQRVAGVDEVEVTIVWDPPWTRGRISEAARLELGLF
jgi:probable FeS assembly SUF system protein SufT